MTITKQFRFPRSKKRRIQKKWRKNPRNTHTIPDRNCIVAGNKLICHPVVAKELVEAVKEGAGLSCGEISTALRLIGHRNFRDNLLSSEGCEVGVHLGQQPIYGYGRFNGFIGSVFG